jgi:hypothetical protein
MKTDECLLCGEKRLKFVREPLGSLRGAKVYVCESCGLAQSRFEALDGGEVVQVVESRGDGLPRPSSLADYGNLRIGKVGREGSALFYLKEAARLFGKTSEPESVLDVGSSRGLFCEAVKREYPRCHVAGLEPDVGVVPEAAGYVRVPQRLERFHLTGSRWDWIALIHTLEHLGDPVGQLGRLRDALSPDRGLLYVEVPDVGSLLKAGGLVEELFIDKHVCHFSEHSLSSLLVRAGLRVLMNGTDSENLWAICSTEESGDSGSVMSRATAVRRMVTLTENYGKMFIENVAKMEEAMPRLNRVLDGKAIVAFGAGRILDAMKRAGLDLDLVGVIVDSNHAFIDSFNGCLVSRPGILEFCEVDHVLVCSRSSAPEIEAQAMKLAPKTEIIRWDSAAGLAFH